MIRTISTNMAHIFASITLHIVRILVRIAENLQLKEMNAKLCHLWHQFFHSGIRFQRHVGWMKRICWRCSPQWSMMIIRRILWRCYRCRFQINFFFGNAKISSKLFTPLYFMYWDNSCSNPIMKCITNYALIPSKTEFSALCHWAQKFRIIQTNKHYTISM